MKYSRHILTIILTIAISSLLMFGCKDDSTGPEVDEGPAPPAITVTSQNVTLNTGEEGITFFVASNVNVTLAEVKIKNPRNTNFSYNLNNNLLTTSQSMALQPAGQGYTKFSGTWTFQFSGNHSPGNEPFNVTAQVNVGAKEISQ